MALGREPRPLAGDAVSPGLLFPVLILGREPSIQSVLNSQAVER